MSAAESVMYTRRLNSNDQYDELRSYLSVIVNYHKAASGCYSLDNYHFLPYLRTAYRVQHSTMKHPNLQLVEIQAQQYLFYKMYFSTNQLWLMLKRHYVRTRSKNLKENGVHNCKKHKKKERNKQQPETDTPMTTN